MRDDDYWVKRLTAAAEAGEVVDLDPEQVAVTAHHDPDAPDEVRNERWIPASAIRTVLVKTVISDIDPRGVRIRYARIVGDVDWDGLQFDRAIHLTDCMFEHLLDISSASIRELSLQRSTIPGAALDGMEITGHLFADRLIATGQVRAIGARIDGQVSLNDAKLTNPGGDALALEGAQITGGLFADRLIATGRVRAIGARIDSQVNLNDTKLTNPGGDALLLDQAHITGGLFAKGLIATGQVRAIGARIDGQVSLNDAKLTNPNGNALTLEQAHITGGLFAKRLIATGQVRAGGARIDSQVNLNDTKLTNPNGNALTLDGAQITGGLVADRLIATGQVRAGGARIDSPVNLNDAKLTNPGGVALMLDQAQLRSGLFADRLIATGQVRAGGACIGGQVILRSTKFFTRRGFALRLDHAQIPGILMAHGMIATGEVSAHEARIGQFALTDVAFYKGLKLTASHIGQLILRPRPGHAFGEIALERATVGNLVLGNASVRHGPRRQVPKGFDHCTISALGWKIGDLHGPLRNDPKIAAELLDRTAGRAAPPQPRYELAACYDRIGRPDFARITRLTAEQSVTSRSTGTTKVLRWIYAATVGYGYRPFLPVLWLIATLVLAGALVWGGRDHFIPVNRADAVAAFELADGVTPTAVDGCSDTTGYPCFNSLGYTLQNVVPAASGPLRPDWVLSNTGTGAIALGFALALLRLLAWGFAALTLAAVTGLLRRH